MVAWYWLIVSALCGIAFAKVCEEIFDWDNILTEFIAFCTLVVTFIPIVVWNNFFRMTINPVSEDELKKAKLTPKKRWGNLCFFIDKKASHWWNRMFFVRIKKKPVDK